MNNITQKSSFALHQFADVLIYQATEDLNISGFNIPKGYVNATQICQINNKRWAKYSETKQAQEYLRALDNKLFKGESEKRTDLIIVIDKGSNDTRGTWIHHLIALDLARWISPEFSVWASEVLWLVINNNYQALTPEALKAQQQVQNIWNELRQLGILTRNEFTFQIKEYMLRHPELSDNDRQWMYPNVSDMINQYVFGKKAKQLCEERNCERNKLRDSHKHDDLKTIELIENTAARQILKDKHPKKAVELAIEFLF